MLISQIVLINLGIALGVMVVMWMISLAVKDASIVDPYWGVGFVVLAWCTWFMVDPVQTRSWLLVAMVTIWGLRLSGYLFLRNRGKQEDRRYQAMREKHGDNFWWVSLFTVFLLQGLIMWVVSITFQSGMALSNDPALVWLDWVGLVIWSIGLFFEAVGDWQMSRFKSDPANQGKVMNRGLWRYTRHPNYFGDFCIWWGVFIVSAAAGGWWTIFGPLLMSFLLLKVSGVTLLEKDIEERRPGYREYKLRTNSFFPGPPRSLDDADS